VLKVGRVGATDLGREVAVALEAASGGAPVVQPLSEVIASGAWLVTLWPFVARRAEPPSPVDVSAALRKFHDAMASSTLELPPVVDTLGETAALAEDDHSLSALEAGGRALLGRALRRVALEVAGVPTVVVHGEPHDGNVIAGRDGVLLIDFEAAKRAPVEWDLAFRPDSEVRQLWPDADADLLEVCRLGVSAGVATYCWRHVSARPSDRDMRSHADHHLARVRAWSG
jgi:hypothetical protein